MMGLSLITWPSPAEGERLGTERTVAMCARKRGFFISLGLSIGLIVLTLGLLGAMSQPPLAVARSLGDNVSGVITQSTTWDLASSPYTLTGNVVITAGVALTVEPGVVVMGGDGTYLEVLGHLQALGTMTQPITFTSSADSGRGQWVGLVFDGGTGHLRHATVRYGGDAGGVRYANITVRNVLAGGVRIENSRVLSESGGNTPVDYGLYVENSHVVVSDTTFANNGDRPKDYGLYAEVGSVVTVTGCIFENNYGRAVGVGADSVHRVTGNSFSGNGYDRVQIVGGSVVTGATLVPQTGLEGYELKENLTVPGGVTLTVEPGVRVMGEDGTRLEVLGHLSAVGTGGQPITFTSLDDSGPREWAGLLFDGGTGHLRHATVRYGGQDDGIRNTNITVLDVMTGEVRIESSDVLTTNSDYGLYVRDSHVVVSDTTFAGNGNSSGDCGLYAEVGSVVTVTGSIFRNNTGRAVGVGADSVHRVTGNSFSGNEYDRVRIVGGSVVTGATLVVQSGLEGYELRENLAVPGGVTLTVEPGVRVMGEGGTQLEVLGHLSAVGTGGQPITFTSSADSGPGEWAGLLFDGGTGRLRHATVRYGGQRDSENMYTNITLLDVMTGEVCIESSEVLTTNGDYGLYVKDSRVVVSDTTFANNGNDDGDYGLYAEVGSVVTVTSSIFRNNTGRAVGVGADSVHRVTGNSFSGNEYDRVRIVGGSVVTGTTLVPQNGLEGYELIENLNLAVPGGVTLTVEPGVTVMGEGGTRLEVLGHLSAVGTGGQPITFTSSSDSGPRGWEGLLFDGGTGHLRHTVVRYGGQHDDIVYSNITVQDVLTGEVRIEDSRVLSGSRSTTWTDYGLYVENSHVIVSGTTFANNGDDGADYGLRVTDGSIVTITGSTFRDNAGTGVRVDDSQVTMTCVTVANNQEDGIRLAGAGTIFSIFSSGISGNSDYGLRNEIGVTVTTRYNWWGASSGPYHLGLNPSGAGDEVSDYVDFDPWLKKAMCASTSDADLAVASAISPDIVIVEGPLTYTFTITNYGPSDATSVTQTHTLPANVAFGGIVSSKGICTGTSIITCALGSLALNEIATITTVATPTTAGTVAEVARVMGNRYDPDLSDNSLTVETVVSPAIALTLTEVGSSDVVTAGNPLSYVVTVINGGPSDAADVTFTDILPTSAAFDSATFSQGTGCGESGGTITCNLGTVVPTVPATVTISVTVDPLARGVITNTIEVTGTGIDLYMDDNVITETTVVNAEADLAVVKSGSSNVVTVGSPLTYTVTVANDGPSAATGVILTDSLPSSVIYGSAMSSQGTGCSESGGTVTCALDTLNSTGVVTITLVVTPTTGGAITNMVSVAGIELDPNTAVNNTDEERTTISTGQPTIYLPLVLRN
jgi:uncharacterized repeat protein (TIGR01451 family)